MTTFRPTIFSLSPLSQHIDDMFKSAFAPRATRGARARAFPALRAWQDDKAITVEAELPGFKLEEIEISMIGRELTIKGRRAVEAPEQSELLLDERGEGEFARTVRVGTPIDADKVEAALREGVLTITLPKVEAAQPKRIVVKASDN